MLTSLIVAFLSCCLLSILYWQVIQPVVLKGIRFRLFARRDQLRRLAIDNKEDFESFPYREAESLICKTLAILPSVSLASFIWFSIQNSDAENKDFERFRKEASPCLIRLMHKTAGDGLFILLLNSPIIASSSMLIAFILWIVGRFNRLLIYKKAENFIDELPNDFNDYPNLTQQAA